VSVRDDSSQLLSKKDREVFSWVGSLAFGGLILAGIAGSVVWTLVAGFVGVMAVTISVGAAIYQQLKTRGED